MTEPKELELKLLCDPAALAVLRDWPGLAIVRERGKDRLESVYFDTPDCLLRKSGYVLRVRRTRGGYIQTVKAEGDGLIERPEWEQPVAGAEPDRAALDATPLAKLLGKKSKLAPLFGISIERTTCLVEQGNSLIEIALDRGHVGRTEAEGEPRATSISEIELELKQGAIADLFALTREIGRLVAIRLGVESKAERGFDLIEARSGRGCKAAPIALSEDMTAAEAFRAIAHGCLRHLRMNEEVLLERGEAEALHQARVAIRRLRSAMSLFKVLLADDRFEAIRAQLKALSEPLGRARNLDIFLSETLPAARARAPDDLQLQDLAKHLEQARAEAYAAVLQRLRSEEWRHFFLDLVAWINAGPWLSEGDWRNRDEPAPAFASHVLDKFSQRVRKRGRDLSALSVEERHKVRIATKKLRYGAEFFASLYTGKAAGKRRKHFLSALSDLQESLGALNDIASGQALLDSLASSEGEDIRSLADRFAAVRGARKTKKLLKAAEDAHASMVECQPFWR